VTEFVNRGVGNFFGENVRVHVNNHGLKTPFKFCV